ncbi:MAG: acetyltransferase [Burkholderiales bacterium RIFCSPLOWO2_02_FULL_57_36]|nr:MAG: acetyltransferase [Burkholderiales bacterium RIFCSPLOWO2_02_FULL_57_36]
MAHFDVFNGDADGICALHQLRLADPREATLVTGVKRDIALLERVDAHSGDSVTVLDVSIDVNRQALVALLERGVTVQYFDHHGSGEVPVHARLHAVINTAPAICTGIIVDRWLGGAHRIWTIVAAFGDNFAQAARKLAAPLGLQTAQLDLLQELGECVNYNAYVDNEADLVMHPAALYSILHRHADPFTFIGTEPVFQELRESRRLDLNLARRIQPLVSALHGKVMLLPDAPWSRRVRGVYGNLLATGSPDQAHAILVPDTQGGYTVSVRAPFSVLRGADALCRQFAGGGRPAAAGINHLPQDKLPVFIDAFEQAFRRP